MFQPCRPCRQIGGTPWPQPPEVPGHVGLSLREGMASLGCWLATLRKNTQHDIIQYCIIYIYICLICVIYVFIFNYISFLFIFKHTYIYIHIMCMQRIWTYERTRRAATSLLLCCNLSTISVSSKDDRNTSPVLASFALSNRKIHDIAREFRCFLFSREDRILKQKMLSRVGTVHSSFIFL